MKECSVDHKNDIEEGISKFEEILEMISLSSR